jgi:hypothetical protein
LIDWTILEFYNEDRILLIRGKTKEEQDRVVEFNSMNLASPMGEPGNSQPYWPKVDIEISVGEGIKRSKAFTLAATQELANMNITPQNVPIVKSIVEILDLPNKQEVMEALDVMTQQAQIQMAQAQMMAPQAPPPEASPQAQSPTDAMLSQLPPEQAQFVQQMLASMPPEEAQRFMQLPPDQQAEAIAQAIGGGQNG